MDDVNDKNFCLTYDGATAAVMVGQEVIARETFSNAMFMHCYAHQLNLVFLHGSKTIKSVLLFLGDLTMFYAFFSGSAKQTELLREKGGFLLPETKWWNCRSRVVLMILSSFYRFMKNIECNKRRRPGSDVCGFGFRVITQIFRF